MKDVILALKFHRQRGAAVAAVAVLRPVVPARGYDVVTSVPISPARYRERGYNQSELLARAMARELRLPYRSYLERTTSTHQLGLSRTDRLAGIRGAFWARRGLAGERVLIVDDVVTTGATLDECARVLVAAGSGEVWGLALARH